jgi:hypothetical protein
MFQLSTVLETIWSRQFWREQWQRRQYRDVINYFGDKKIFETVTDTNIKQFLNNMKTHKVFLEVFVMFSISYFANVDAIFEFFPCSSQLWLVDHGCGLWHRRLVYLFFRISSEVNVAWSNIWRSEASRNGCCSSYPSLRQAELCLLHLRGHFHLIVIGGPLADDELRSVLRTETY